MAGINPMKFLKINSLIVVTGILASSLTLSQTFSLTPINGANTLSAGFLPDPHIVPVFAGGNLQASNASSGCSGFITDAPSYRLNYEAGSSTLSIYINAAFDTTLLINTPNGDWVCDDDNDNLDNLNSGWYFDNAASGQYDIWVGTYSESNNNGRAILAISEYSESTWDRDLHLNSSVFVPEISLTGGFSPDPYTIDVVAGGPNQASTLDSSCSGYVGANPSYRLNFSPGSLGLGIYTLSDIDTTLAIRSPSGIWNCNDDNSNLENTLNSGYYFSSPETGIHDIYVGAFSEGSVGQSATLAITEFSESSWNPNSVIEIPDGEIQFGSKLL